MRAISVPTFTPCTSCWTWSKTVSHIFSRLWNPCHPSKVQTKCMEQWDRFFSRYFGFHVSTIPPKFCTPILFIYYWCYIIWAIDSIIKQFAFLWACSSVCIASTKKYYGPKSLHTEFKWWTHSTYPPTLSSLITFKTWSPSYPRFNYYLSVFCFMKIMFNPSQIN